MILLVITQSTASHHRLCVQYWSLCVRVCAICLIIITTVHLGNKIFFVSFITACVTGHVNSCNAKHTILIPSVPDTVSIRQINLRNRRCRKVFEPLGDRESTSCQYSFASSNCQSAHGTRKCRIYWIALWVNLSSVPMRVHVRAHGIRGSEP